jgi:endoglucanase
MKHITLFFLFAFPVALLAQPVVYKDASSLITGTWHGAGAGGTSTFAEVTGQTPHEGNKHYKFDYSFTDWWAGIGLNMDGWGNNPAKNFSGYTHLRIAYRGLSAGQTFRIQLRNGNDFGNLVDIGPTNSAYAVVDIPMVSLTVGTPVSANAVREIDVSIASTTQAGSGSVFFDAIELVNVSGGPAATTAATNARAASLGLGLNTSNWLEAFWLLPFNAYPEVNRYTRTKVRDLNEAGFNTFRLPVTFERLGSTTPPFALDFNNVAFALVDSMILWAQLYDFKLIIDNHHGFPLDDNNYLAEIPRLRAVWQQLTDRYDYLDPERYLLEAYNEPNGISNSSWRVVATNIVEEIRANETQTHSVLVGGNGWNSGNGLITFTPLADSNIIYTFHNYDPYFFTHQGMSWTTPPNFPPRTFPLGNEVAEINSLFAAVKAWGTTYNVPVNLGEFGCSTAADANSRCNWINTLTTAINTNNLSHFYWDAISPADAFGFYNGGIISSATCIPCFKNALGLYSVLPVSVVEFGVDCAQEGGVNLAWKAVSTDYLSTFHLERSTDGIRWETIDAADAQQGAHQYTYRDASIGAYLYRLAMVDGDGKLTYSPIRKVVCSEKGIVVVFPNPASDVATVAISEKAGHLEAVALYDIAGRLVWQKSFNAQDDANSVLVPTSEFPAGIYLMQVRTNIGSETTELVIGQ